MVNNNPTRLTGARCARKLIEWMTWLVSVIHDGSQGPALGDGRNACGAWKLMTAEQRRVSLGCRSAPILGMQDARWQNCSFGGQSEHEGTAARIAAEDCSFAEQIKSFRLSAGRLGGASSPVPFGIHVTPRTLDLVPGLR